jgi:uncharacterized protein YegL
VVLRVKNYRGGAWIKVPGFSNPPGLGQSDVPQRHQEHQGGIPTGEWAGPRPAEPRDQEQRRACLPTYILIDTSSAMKSAEVTLNETLEDLYEELMMSPRISDFVRVSIISFNTDAHVVLAMTDIQQITALPQLKCSGVTNFSRAFQVLRQCIERDVPMLSALGRGVLRPVAFLLTGDQPTDENGRLTQSWRDEHARLTDKAWGWHPNIVPFGFGGATADVLRDMATINEGAFLGMDTGNKEPLRKIFAMLLNTLVASSRKNEWRMPTEVGSFIRVSQDIIE